MLKRPLAVVGISYFCTLLAATFLNFNGVVAIFVISSIAIIGLLVFRAKNILLNTVAITVLIASLVYMLYTCVCYLPFESYDGRVATVTAQIVDIKQTQSGHNYILQVEQIGGGDVQKPFKCVMYSKNKIEADYYDKIIASGEFVLPDTSAFNKNKADSVYLKFFTDTPFYDNESVITVSQKPIRYEFIKIREYISESISTMISKENAQLLKGIIIGADENVSQDIKESFSKSGMEHILTLSGYHIVLLTGMASIVLDFAYIGRKKKTAIMLFVVALFVGVAGFTASAIRAAVMSSALFISPIFSRRGDSLNSLGLASLVLTLFNPYAAYDLGLILSFFSTLGIILFSSKLTQYIIRKLKVRGNIGYAFVGFFATSLSASIMISPVCIGAFSGLSLVAPLANMLVSPIISMIMYTGIVVAIFGKIPFLRVVVMPISIICDALLTFVTSCTRFFQSIPLAYLKIGFNYIYLMLAGCGIIVLVGLFCKQRSKAVVSAICFSLVVIVASVGSYSMFANNTIIIGNVKHKGDYNIVVTYKDRAVVINRTDNIELARKTASYLDGKFARNIEMYINTGESPDNSVIEYYKDNFNLMSVVSDNPELYEDITTYPLCDMTVSLSSKINLKLVSEGDSIVIKGDYGAFSFAVADTYPQATEAFQGSEIQALVLYSKANKETGDIGRDYIITLGDIESLITKNETLRDKTVQIIAHHNGNSCSL